MAKRTPVSASAVRAWFSEAQPEGVRAPGSRGRLHPETVEAFEKANPGKTYVLGTQDASKVTLTVTGTNKRGHKTSRKVEVPVSEARALAGEAAGRKGRLSEAAVAAASEALSAQRAAAKSTN